ncbi:MAG: type II secretion system protein GspJ [Hyphomonadaceae bacterium]|jgi:general secretion pathway protein J
MTAPKDAGFTLTEALVSLFVFSLVAGGAVTLLTQSLNSQASVSASQEALRALQSARALLTADLAQIAPRQTREEGRLPITFQAANGARPSMSFVRSLGERGSEDGLSTTLVFVEYVVDDAGRLVRRMRNALDPGEAADMQSRILLPDATGLQFEFNAGTGWISDWPPAATSVPRAVAIIATAPRYGAIRIQAVTGL